MIERHRDASKLGIFNWDGGKYLKDVLMKSPDIQLSLILRILRSLIYVLCVCLWTIGGNNNLCSSQFYRNLLINTIWWHLKINTNISILDKVCNSRVAILCLRRVQCARLATRILLAVPMTFMTTQQRTHAICNPKWIAVFVSLEKN